MDSQRKPLVGKTFGGGVQKVVFVAGVEGIAERGMRILRFFYVIIKSVQFKRLDQQRTEGVVKRRLLPPPNTLARQHYRQAIALSNIFDVAGVSPLIGAFK